MPKGVVRAVVLPIAIVVGLFYAGAAVAVSLTSQPVELPRGEAYAFCGFYIDCHLSAAVDSVALTPVASGGTRYLVRVRFANSARRATLTMVNPHAALVDAMGTRIRPISQPRDVTLGPGTSLVAEFLFEAPAPLVEPRLHVSEGSWVERLTEKVLIGDPDSFLHAPVLLKL